MVNCGYVVLKNTSKGWLTAFPFLLCPGIAFVLPPGVYVVPLSSHVSYMEQHNHCALETLRLHGTHLLSLIRNEGYVPRSR